MPGSFRFVPACGCCDAACNLLMGPFCDCCGLLASGSLRIWDGGGFDKAFPITNGYASVTVPRVGTYHSQIVAPYTPRTLNDFTVTQTFNPPTSSYVCNLSPPVSGYAPPDRPATLTVTNPDGTTATLYSCGTINTCNSNQLNNYMGSTAVTLSHGLWCGTASTVTLPVAYNLRIGESPLNVFGIIAYQSGCFLEVWVPVCHVPIWLYGNTIAMSVCGFPVSNPGTCVDAKTIIIPTPPSTDPFFPPTPCGWFDIANHDLVHNWGNTYRFVCDPLYWRSGYIPPLQKINGRWLPQSACSLIWPGGGYITVTA